jgi:hypothetical protein
MGDENEGKSSNKATGTSANRGEYSRMREANIAENKRLLSELGLLSASSSLVDKKEEHGKKNKRKKDHPANPIRSESSGRGAR